MEGVPGVSSAVALGLDLGGSSVKACLLGSRARAAPKVLRTETWPLDGDRSPVGVIGTLQSIVEHFGVPDLLGLAIPATIDPGRGLSLVMPNFPAEWRGFAVVDAVHSAVGLRPTLINDAKAFSVAETTLGAGRGWDLVACLVLGTGVGGGIVHHGRLWTGSGTAGEFGHIIVDPEGPRCGCGSRGCVEAVAGGEAIEVAAGRPTVEDAFRAAGDGDVRAAHAIDRATSALASAMASITATLAPDVFVVGGGVAAAGDALLGPLRGKLLERVNIIPPSQVRVHLASLGREAGSIGAALNSIHDSAQPD
jgi:glucokinase